LKNAIKLSNNQSKHKIEAEMLLAQWEKMAKMRPKFLTSKQF